MKEHKNIGSTFDTFLQEESVEKEDRDRANRLLSKSTSGRVLNRETFRVSKCIHCRDRIIQMDDKHWLDSGLIFPQYCRNFDGPADQLHEPTTIVETCRMICRTCNKPLFLAFGGQWKTEIGDPMGQYCVADPVHGSKAHEPIMQTLKTDSIIDPFCKNL